MATIINAGTTALTVTPDATGALTIQANGTSALAITANGQITTANAPFILTGGQIQFPATQIASGDGNCLDDYEEGTWTPTVNNMTSVSYSVRVGVYNKIGNFVTGLVYLQFTGSQSGGITIGGLPFTSGSNGAGGGSVTYQDFESTVLQLYVGTGATVVEPIKNGSTSWVCPTGTNKYIIGVFNYRV
jgi:hypothetical protein